MASGVASAPRESSNATPLALDSHSAKVDWGLNNFEKCRRPPRTARH